MAENADTLPFHNHLLCLVWFRSYSGFECAGLGQAQVTGQICVIRASRAFDAGSLRLFEIKGHEICLWNSRLQRARGTLFQSCQETKVGLVETPIDMGRSNGRMFYLHHDIQRYLLARDKSTQQKYQVFRTFFCLQSTGSANVITSKHHDHELCSTERNLGWIYITCKVFIVLMGYPEKWTVNFLSCSWESPTKSWGNHAPRLRPHEEKNTWSQNIDNGHCRGTKVQHRRSKVQRFPLVSRTQYSASLFVNRHRKLCPERLNFIAHVVNFYRVHRVPRENLSPPSTWAHAREAALVTIHW